MPSSDVQEITGLLVAWRGGDDAALTDLMPLVYQRLREIAGYLVRGERSGHTLETTALVHEAFLRLVDIDRIGWRDRAHFFAMCARIMRRVLVDHARYQCRDKRGGRAHKVECTELLGIASERAPRLIALDEALSGLAKQDAEMARIVELRFFGGLEREELAEVMGMSSATVTRRWRAARAWLISYLNPETQ
ncbi:MAG: sigma-70 family RNA polymerase sigma factor [Acidobacteriota bacterium]